jgi:4-amino-4-deoxy-L-arabinose transferase-like glycosyltransferase
MLAIFALAVFFAKLGLNGMANFDDCFYAEEAKEILRTGHWSYLNYNYHPAFHNAPLFMWLVALSYKVFGVTVFAAKFPSALMGFLTVGLVYLIGKNIVNRQVGVYSAFILATTYPFLKYSRHAMLDVTLAFFVTAAMGALVLAIRKDRKFFLLWGLCIGLTILTKSLFGVFPVIVTVLFLILTKRGKELLNPYFLMGIALFTGITAAWVWTQYSVGGQDFINVHLKFIILNKISGDDSQSLLQHFGLFKDLLVYYWPWLPLAVFGLVILYRNRRWDMDKMVYLSLWSLTVLALLVPIQTKFLWYLMQSFPALAIVSAIGLDQWAYQEKWENNMRKGLTVLCACAGILLFALPIPLDKDREKDTRIIAPYVKYFANRGAKIIGLKEEYWGLNNALLFFSDHAAEPLFTKAQDLKPLFDSKDLVLCVAHKEDVADLNKNLPTWVRVKDGEDLILIANQPVQTIDVQKMEGPWKN